VAFDLVAGGFGEIAHEVGDSALVEVFDGAAVGADEVVVVPALGEAVVEAAVLEEDAADDSQLGQEADSAEDRRAAGAPAAVKEVVDGEVIALSEHGSDHGPAGGRHAVAARFEFEGYGFKV
jgi:hypothetical protein